MPISTRIFSAAQARAIQRKFEEVVKSEGPLSVADMRAALAGIFTKRILQDMTADNLRWHLDFAMQNVVHTRLQGRKLVKAFLRLPAKQREVYVHADSLAAWMKAASEQYGLEARDIAAMNYGERLDVVLMDRNVGDYYRGKPGSTFNPLERGLTYAEYVHDEGYTGVLLIEGNVWPHWTWEVNSTRRKRGRTSHQYWGPLALAKNGKPLEPVPGRLKVGWRGPAIARDVARRKLPKRVRYYSTWWDDGNAYQVLDLLSVKRREA